MIPSTRKSSDSLEENSSQEKPESEGSRHSIPLNSADEQTSENKPSNETEVNETQVVSPKVSKIITDIVVDQPKSLEENTSIKESVGKFPEFAKSLTNVFTFPSQEPTKKHVFLSPGQGSNNRSAIPPPPNYYRRPASNPSSNNRPPRPQEQPPVRQNNNIEFNRFHTPQPMDFTFGNIFINPNFWCPYPSTIPSNIPPSLAHFIDLDAVFVTRSLEILEYIIGYDIPDTFLIQNKNGECLYYAYERYDFISGSCCQNMRGLQLIIKDLYQNEVIYMNKCCGCNQPCLFCCFPLMEIYAPPTVPAGAILRVCESIRDDFVILDADENRVFTIQGSCTGNFLYKCSELEYTIHALDENRTVVGYIRREIGDYRTRFLNSQVSGVSFPSNLDVRIKAIFLGALMLIVATKRKFKKGGGKDTNSSEGNDEYLKMSIPSNPSNVISFLHLIGKLKCLKRTGWVLRNVEDPETVSGHMYRMSIMTFLIPESSGVDKTRCMKLSLVHDLAECIVGDLTPFCGVDASEKHRQEEVAMKELTQMIGDSGAEIYKLYKEYEAQVTDESKFVKDLDRLDMILQAFEYEKLGDKPGKLEEFFASTINKFNFPWTIDIVKEIYKQRNLHINKEKCTSKDL